MTKIGLGLAALGRPEYINIKKDENIDKSELAFKNNAFEMLNTAYNSGIRYFDTAPSYGKGEYFLKEWQKSNHYNDTFLATKWGYTYVANWQLGYKGAHEIKEHSIDKLIEQWETSKELLPNLKVYQIHSATLESGVLKNIQVLTKLYEIKLETGIEIGITTSGANQNTVLKEAAEVKIQNKYLFDIFQVTYNIFEQSTYQTLLDLSKVGRKIVIKEGVANGRIFENTSILLQNLSAAYHVEIDAIALRFIIDTINPYIILSGAFTKDQLVSNLKCKDIKLTEEDLIKLKELKEIPLEYWHKRKMLQWK